MSEPMSDERLAAVGTVLANPTRYQKHVVVDAGCELLAEVERLRGNGTGGLRADRITGRELAEVINQHPEWLDLPVHLLSITDDSVWLCEIERDCFDPSEGPVLSLVAFERRRTDG